MNLEKTNIVILTLLNIKIQKIYLKIYVLLLTLPKTMHINLLILH